MIKNENYLLKNGIKIPKIGFGTWQVKNGKEAYDSVYWALEAGYRHIDTALVYENEKSVGDAIKDSKINREDLFITTKLPSHIKTYDEAISCFYESLENLGTDYIDLYLIHAPWPWSNVGEDCKEGNVEVWKAMIHLYNCKKVKAIGVSNFQPDDIQNLIDNTGFIPHVNQIRFFIGNTQEHIVEYCNKHNILIEAYSPLATGGLINDPKLLEIANKYHTSVPKLCIRYCIERGTLPLPKSVNQSRIIDNLDVDFTIEKSDMEFLNSFVIKDDLKRKLRS